MTYPFFTIGHSNRTFDAFAALLQEAEIELLADIRTVPRSRANPQFNLDVLPASLASHHIEYEHIASLGGLRGKSKTVPRQTNGFWENDSFHNYADYALSGAFHQGLEHLIARGPRPYQPGQHYAGRGYSGSRRGFLPGQAGSPIIRSITSIPQHPCL
jgi:hypothetical protein